MDTQFHRKGAKPYHTLNENRRTPSEDDLFLDHHITKNQAGSPKTVVQPGLFFRAREHRELSPVLHVPKKLPEKLPENLPAFYDCCSYAEIAK